MLSTVLLVLALVVVILIVLAVLVWVFRRRDHLTETITSPVRRVAIEDVTGTVQIRGRDAATIDATFECEWGLIRPRPSARVHGDTLEVEGGHRGGIFGPSIVHVALDLPRAVALDVELHAGNVEAVGLYGPLDLETSAGSITVRDVSGDLDLESSTGAIRVEGATSHRAELSTGAGMIDAVFASPPQRIEAESGAGSVTVRVPDGPYRVKAEAGVGGTEVDVETDPQAKRLIKARSGVGRVHVLRAR